MTENQKNVEKHSVLGDFGHLMEMLWIPLISQIGRNHQNMWKKTKNEKNKNSGVLHYTIYACIYFYI